MPVGKRKYATTVLKDMRKPYSLLRQAVTDTGSWAAAIMVPNPKQGVLDCGPYLNFPEDWKHITNDLNDTTVNGRSYLSGKPEYIDNITIDQPQGGTTHHYMSAIAVVPIKQNAKVIGTLEVIKDKEGAKFTQSEIRLLEKIANQLTTFV